MNRRVLIALPLVVVALLVVAAGSWWFFIRESNSLATSAPDIPTELVASTPGAGSTAAASTSGTAGSGDPLTFTILPARSDASYFVGEKLAALPLPSTAKGSTNAITGSFRLTPSGDLDPSHPAKFTVDLTQLRSDKDMRDARVQSQGLQTQTFPKATFTATKVTGWDASAPAGQEQDVQLTGTLDLHGVKKEVTWDVKARHEGNVITALATTNFKFADFNIPILNIAGFVSIEDNVTLQVQVVAQSGSQ